MTQLCRCHGNAAVTMHTRAPSSRGRTSGSGIRNAEVDVNGRKDRHVGSSSRAMCGGFRWLRLVPVLLLMVPVVVALDPEAMTLINSEALAASGGRDYEVDRAALKRERKICSSLDIRNSIAELSQLEGCEVVEGFVMIVLIEEDKETGQGFVNKTYPQLREISGYLLLYRVYGLRSLKDLFPNLSVIRGQQLFFDFSLVVYELMALKELGLRSLTDIQRGSVLIEKNPNLCYVETIQWDLITKKGEHNFINSNKKPSECKACPDHCPSSPSGDRLCWTNDYCQKVCEKECKDKGRSCYAAAAITSEENRGRYKSWPCCHEECAGGCSGPGIHQCDVCKHVSHNGQCLPMCPSNFYLYLDRRCVTQQQCVATPPPRGSNHKEGRWKPIEEQSECSMECPPGHEEKQETSIDGKAYYTCKKCNGACPKVCLGALINNIETAQQLKGCSAIQGDLEMQIKGGTNIVQELEKNLGDIEEIHGTLKIVRSFPLLSLNFLKKLRIIHGRQPRQKKDDEKGLHSYALVVQDNQNLQKLFMNETGNRTLQIHGKMMFHFNPKLCLDLIRDLHNYSIAVDVTTGLKPNMSDTDVSPWSNGDKATCSQQNLTVTIDHKSDKSIVIKWSKDFRESLEDRRQLLGYVISYIEAPHQNVTYYDGRDACGGDGWTINDVDEETNIITLLKPYTQYAIYVQTYTVAPQNTGKRVGARSDIIYVRTDPAEPSQPQNLKADATSNAELEISWEPPKYPNGIVSQYTVRGRLREEDMKYYDSQNSCAVSNENQVKKSVMEPNTSVNNRTQVFSGVSGKCCECSAKNSQEQRRGPDDKKEKERKFKIDFENYLHNKVYVKTRSSSSERSKRSINRSNASSDSAGTGDRIPDVFPEADSFGTGNKAVGPMRLSPDPDDDPYVCKKYEKGVPDPNFVQNGSKRVAFCQMVTDLSELKVTVDKVWHYAEYTIEVIACHVYDKNPTKVKLCSIAAVTSVRSKEIDDKDNINSDIEIGDYNYTTSSMKVSWKEPDNPNGLIIKYNLEYRRTDVANPKLTTECVLHTEFMKENRSKTLVDLSPGDYSMQIRAQSLAKWGNPSAERWFTIHEPDRAMDWRIIVGIVLVVLLISIFIVAIGGYYLIKKRRHIQTITSINPDYHKYEVDGWEVGRENVALIRELGQGSFGMVYEGIVRNVVYQEPEAKCAVKTVNDKASVSERIQFLNEASVMKEFNAHHVVKLLGVVSKAQPTLVIMELMASGDLKTYLRSHRPDCEENVMQGRQPPTLKCILKMAIEIADGMSYLSDKKFVHRDLAARNCMVAEDLTVKIGDFGMTRDIYETDYYRKGGKGLLPVRWMAPESLRDGVFTSQCDVWSFGVVLWEMATLASQPYQGLSNEQVLKYVMDGGVMERPERCPDRLYDLMKTCWYYQAKHRPTFLDIIADLLPDVPVQFASVSFYHSDMGVIARAAQKAYHEQENRKLNDPSTPLRSSMDLVDDDMYSSRESLQKQLHPPYTRGQVFQIDDDNDVPSFNASSDAFELDHSNLPHNVRAAEDSMAKQPLQEEAQEEEEEEQESEDEENADRLRDADADDHVAVLIPKDQRVYVLVKNPTSNGSKSDASKGTTVSSEDSKGSYVSNGSASNGYVMGILKQRRQNNTEC